MVLQVHCQAHLLDPQANYPGVTALETTHYPASQAPKTTKRNTYWLEMGLEVRGRVLGTGVLPVPESWVLPAACSCAVGGFAGPLVLAPAAAPDWH